MSLPDVILTVCVGVEVHLTGRGGRDEGCCGDEEGVGELHLAFILLFLV